jgi:hypothetical protein
MRTAKKERMNLCKPVRSPCQPQRERMLLTVYPEFVEGIQYVFGNRKRERQ